MNKEQNKGWRENFDTEHPPLGDKDVDSIFRFCRLDYPDDDSRSIKSFISQVESQAYKRGQKDGISQTLDKIEGKVSKKKKVVRLDPEKAPSPAYNRIAEDGNKWQEGYNQALADILSTMTKMRDE